MAKFFIDRPVFAWVIALFIILAGILSIRALPVAQYPAITPPSVIVRAVYPGASAKTLSDSVTSLLEQALNGAEGVLDIESNSEASGSAEIIVTFRTGTDPDLATVDVQNKVKSVEPRLPQAVTEQGVQVFKSTSNFLMFVALSSADGTLEPIGLGDYMSRNILNELKRIPGVGEARLFGSENAMRIWVDPARLAGLKLTASDIAAAVRSQNAQVAAGKLGDAPAPRSQRVSAPVVANGQLSSPDEFGKIVLRANSDGSTVRLRDVARIEIGALGYDFSTRLDGKPTAMIGVLLAPSANALATATAVRARMEQLSGFFPPGVAYDIPYDTSVFVRISIGEVVETLVIAMVLVFLLMYLFLQNIRATLIPAIVVPIALMGGFAVMLAFGYSINVLTLFGMVLAIGILVDDAIVVVENVERIMREEGLSPRDATRKAMEQITGAVIGITLVLTAVFIPMAFFGGAVGAIYRQFSLAMVSTMLFSALMALTLTPALCAALFKPPGAAGHHAEAHTGPFAWFNRSFSRMTDRYRATVAGMLGKANRYLVLYALIVACAALLYLRLPSSFLPNEDQGYIMTNIELPAAASMTRTMDVIGKVEQYYLKQPEVARIIAVAGYSFSGNGPNAGLIYTTLRDWSERGQGQSARDVAGRATRSVSNIHDAVVFAVNPPPLPGLGTTAGFSFRLQDRAGLGQEALVAARDRLVEMAANNPSLSDVRPEDLEDTPQLQLDFDRDKANALGVSFADINSTVSILLGSAYLSDFPNRGRQQRVILQADALQRLQPQDVQKLHVRNAQGGMVALSAFTRAYWNSGPVQLVRYNGYPAVRISGEAAPGRSTGEALDEMEKMARQLPAGFGFEWTGQSREEKTSGSQAPALYALSLLAVFLVLAALYESTSIPTAVLLVVPLGIFGALLGAYARDLPNDVYFKVGLIAIIGLSAKNAILIIEFAKDLQARGMGLHEATLAAAALRFRPIVMTSLAFILGVLPLALASGAGSASQRAIGTGVMGGMLSATVLAVFLVPVFFVVVRKGFGRGIRQSPGRK
ncbi:MAG: efflux transporter permease subunit [Herminiimonas sp.]|nr:efflux transporter permease subunit [Herminiimonas sp.]